MHVLGELVFTHDPYLAEIGTLWLLQYRLASNIDEATAWYFFFNEFSMREFTHDNFVTALQNFIKMTDDGDVARRSLDDDFQCIVNTYLPRRKTDGKNFSPENNIVCPFAELGLIDVLNGREKIFRKKCPPIDALNPLVALAVIVDNAGGRKEISLTELLRSPKNVGRVFNLDSIVLLDVLRKLERRQLVKINRTAGLDVLSLRRELTFADCVEKFYASLDGRDFDT